MRISYKGGDARLVSVRTVRLYSLQYRATGGPARDDRNSARKLVYAAAEAPGVALPYARCLRCGRALLRSVASWHTTPHMVA